MSVPGDSMLSEVSDGGKGQFKCRIPQRQTPGRQRSPQFKPKTAVNSKSVVVSSQQPRFAAKPCSRPRSGEQSRPRSANRARDDIGPMKTNFTGTRTGRFEREKLLPALKKPLVPIKKVVEENSMSKKTKPFITVPNLQKPQSRVIYTNRNMMGLPDQETINKHENMELQQSEILDSNQQSADLNDRDSITSRSEEVGQLKNKWQDKLIQFKKMKSELNVKQNAVIELYASLGVTHRKLSGLGYKSSLPDELKVMNVAHMTPDQLLRLCASPTHFECMQRDDDQPPSNIPVSVDVNKLYNMPSKLVGSCEQTLNKRQDIISTLECLTVPQGKGNGITLSQLLNKIKEFNAENEMLSRSLDKVKNEFFGELNGVVGYIRNSVKETMALQVRNQELTCEISELNSQKTDLQKHLHEVENRKSHCNKNKMEELEKQLKEEKCKKNLLRDRLSRAEGQVRISAEQASQLEAALEQARSRCRNLERTVQQLHEQNEHSQLEFDKELKKFTDSIRENTAHLEEIAEAREKLQAEKEDLEKRLTELSNHYSESIKNMKDEMNANVLKLIEIEKRYDDEREEKLKMEEKGEALCAQLLESDLRNKHLNKKLHDLEIQLNKNIDCSLELETTKQELNKANMETESYRDRLNQQGEAIKEIERNFKESLKLEHDLKCALSIKEEYITELEKKGTLLEQQLQESDTKMTSYEEQLTTLKNHITQLKTDFGEFENISELHEMINQQRGKLLEATRQNGELAEALQRKDFELERHITTLEEQEHTIEQRDKIIKILSGKEEEHSNIIKLLRNNLEMRTQTDKDFQLQLSEKDSEIESLVTNLETRKQQINQLEKIILTLEDQSRKANAQRIKDGDNIRYLENKIAEYEAVQIEYKKNIEGPTENLDNIIKILEDELGTSLIPNLNINERTHLRKNYTAGDQNVYGSAVNYDGHDHGQGEKIIMNECDENIPNKGVNKYNKKYTNENRGEKLDRKKAITNMDTQKWISSAEPGLNVFDLPSIPKDIYNFRNKNVSKNYLTRNINFVAPIQIRDDKKCKMFKLAGHRL